jgi:hypothetical protein
MERSGQINVWKGARRGERKLASRNIPNLKDILERFRRERAA